MAEAPGPDVVVRAPFPGATPWASPLVWLGAGIAVIPLWVIFLAQAAVTRRMGRIIRHETGIDGGIIQLYFAGAASFMPLTSDVEVEGSIAERGKVSLVGLWVPTAIAAVLWVLWYLLGNPWILVTADIFLIYPMVQVFPLKPLDGSDLWAWSRGAWIGTFIVVMSTFIFMGSEALKNVI